MIDKATVDKILDAAEIVDVISDFVSLRRRGANFIACCPFHNEKTPSFSVSPSKGIYKCFGCGKAGSSVSFIMEHEQMTYVEALKYLAKKYGIEVREKEETEEDVADRLRHESLLLVSEFAGKFFADTLFDTAVGRAAGLTYFRDKRHFSEETIRKFGLGFAPDSRNFRNSSSEPVRSLAETALKAGYKKEFLLGTGLCIERGSGELVDKFYDRVMFPIHSLSGRVIAFGGRTLLNDKTVAKYVNSPETEIYHKGNSLYGIYFAKSAIAKLQKCYLVEGYADVISMHQAGIANVVASSGTSLTQGQIRLIKRFTNKITVLYDGDAAGIKASIRGIDMLLEEGMEVKVALFPDGQDPDDFAQSHTYDEIVEFLNSSETDFIDFKYELLSKDIARNPIRKAELIREIVRTISLIPDQIVRQVYIEQCSSKLDIKQEILFHEVSVTRRAHIESGEYEKKRAAEREARLAERNAAGAPGTADGFPSEPQGAQRPTSGVEGGAGDYPPPSDVPPAEAYPIDPTQYDEYYGQYPSAENINDITVPSLVPSEKELLYYLLKFGESILVFDEHQLYGSEKPIMNITVAQYISAQLINDDLALLNPIYKKIYDLYFEVSQSETGSVEQSRLQERIQRNFINHPDQTISKTVLDIIVQEHIINVKEYLRALTPEENILGITVPKVVMIFKSKITEYTYQKLMEQLGRAQQDNDLELQTELMQQLKLLLVVKNRFAKELKRL